jgi:outer membrane protein
MKTFLSSKLNKSILFLSIALLGFSSYSSAQRYCYVDTQYILDAITEYGAAQLELDRLSVEWQNQIEAKFALVDKKRKEYEAEAILLPAEIKKQREKEISELDEKAKELQKKYFGVGGELFSKREELIQPIQDEIFKAIKEVSSEKKYAFVFDKANQSNLLFADPKYNISDLVLRKMDITVKKK